MRIILAVVATLCVLVGGIIAWEAHQKELARKDRIMVVITPEGDHYAATPETSLKEISWATNLLAMVHKIKQDREDREAFEQLSNRQMIYIGKLPPPPKSWPDRNFLLTWNPSKDPAVVGYMVYQGDRSRHYTNLVDVGNITGTTLKLDSSVPYYFSVTSYYKNGAESDFGEEVYVAP